MSFHELHERSAVQGARWYSWFRWNYGGGLPQGGTTLLVEGRGSGKTIFGVQFLMHGAEVCQEPGIFVAFEESPKRSSVTIVLDHNDFKVFKAANVPHALKLIGSESFDVLFTDLHLPQVGNGLAVANAIRHTQLASTIIFSGYPEMRATVAAALLQEIKFS